MFPRLPAISVDYGVMEKAEGVLVVPAERGLQFQVAARRTVHDDRVLALQPAVKEALAESTAFGGNLFPISLEFLLGRSCCI